MVASTEQISVVNPVISKAKDQAKHLRSILKDIAPQLTHNIALDAIAKLNGAKDWHVFLGLHADSVKNPVHISPTNIIADQKAVLVQPEKRKTNCGFCQAPVEILVSNETKLIYRSYTPLNIVDFEGPSPIGLNGTVIRPYFSNYFGELTDGVNKGMVVCPQCQPAADIEILTKQDKYTCACPGCSAKLITANNLENITGSGKLKIADYGNPLPEKFGYVKSKNAFCSKQCWDNYTTQWYENNAAIIAEDAILVEWGHTNPEPPFPPLFRLEEYTDDVALVMVVKSLPKEFSRQLFEIMQKLLVSSFWTPRRNQQGIIKWNCHPVPDVLNFYSNRYGAKEFNLPLPLQVYDFFRKQAGMSTLTKTAYEYDGQIWGYYDEPAEKLSLWGG